MGIIFGDKKFKELTESDIQKLIDNSTEESIILEFKKRLCSNSKEIAKDFSAMSNSEGGIIIYGLDEDKNGKAEGINWINSSEEFVNKIENIISTTLNPPIPFKIYVINKNDDATKQIYLAYIPKSKNLHMVIKKGDNRYYKRMEKTIKKMEDSEIKEKIITRRLNEKSREDLIDRLNKDITEFGRIEIKGVKKINYFIIPNELNDKIHSIDSLKSVVEGLDIDINSFGSGRISNTYKDTVTHAKHTNHEKFKSCVIFHKDGTIEFRRSHEAVNYYSKIDFSSSDETKKILELIKLANEFYKEISYFGGYSLDLQLGNLEEFSFSATLSNNGIINNYNPDFIVGIELEPVLTQDNKKNNKLILELMKKLGGNLGINGEEAYKKIKSTLQAS